VTPLDLREYDDNGNLAGLDPGRGFSRQATYDYANRMVAFDDPVTGVVVTYEYDALGRRISRTITDPLTAETTRYYYDGWRVLEEQDAASATQATYVYGRELDEVLSMQRGGTDFYYHGDEQHSVVAVTDAGGNVVERYAYEDYGTPTVFDATGMVLPGTGVGNPYLFTGRRYDPETGWYYYRSRYLDPLAGRFATRDTLGLWGDPASLGNTYTYAGANPATHEDPMGEAILIRMHRVIGDTTTEGWASKGYFIADSFSFGVEREMKESGEKGGTEDINIGVGELQECTVSKSMDTASMDLAQFAINGNSPGQAEIDFVEVAGGGEASGKPLNYLQYKLKRGLIKSWSTSGDADDRPTEEVAFYYDKIAFTYRSVVRKGPPWGTLHDAGSGTYLKYKLDRCFIKSWSTSGDADDRPTEEVAFYYNKIPRRYTRPQNGQVTEPAPSHYFVQFWSTNGDTQIMRFDLELDLLSARGDPDDD
jgi:RHS repeat-associated protein